MWPSRVERVAAVLRAAGVEGRLEELPGDDRIPGPAIRAEGYDCDGRTVIALVPQDSEVDGRKLALAARCTVARLADVPAFPYPNATVLIDRLVLAEQEVWIEAGSPRHVARLAPAQLVHVTHAQATDLAADS